jgi:hypothetical protein
MEQSRKRELLLFCLLCHKAGELQFNLVDICAAFPDVESRMAQAKGLSDWFFIEEIGE